MIVTALTDAFRVAQLNGAHQPHHSYWMALYGPDAELGPHTLGYDPDGECIGLGYHAGGLPLDGRTVRLVDGVACLDWTAPVWDPVTLEAHGCLIYNGSLPGLPSVLTHAFDRGYVATNGPFSPQMPAPGPGSSLIQWPRTAMPTLTGDPAHAR